VYIYEPRRHTYKFTPHKLTPEEEAKVRRHVAEAKRRAYEKLRERDAR